MINVLQIQCIVSIAVYIVMQYFVSETMWPTLRATPYQQRGDRSCKQDRI